MKREAKDWKKKFINIQNTDGINMLNIKRILKIIKLNNPEET